MNDQKPLNILVISSTYPRHEGDYAVPWMREAHARLVALGHQVTVLAPSFKGLRSHQIDGIEVKRFRYAPKQYEILTHEEGASYKVRRFWMQLLAIPYILLGCIAAARIAFRGGYDIILVHWPFPHGMMGQVARAVSGARLVMMSHGAEFALARRKKWVTPFLRQSLNAADLLIANSSDTVAQVTKCCGRSCEIFRSGTTVTAAYSTNHLNRVPRVLFTGRLIERKGVEYLLKAIPAILEKHEATFVITGDGDQRPKLEHLCNELNLGDHVQFLGFVSNEKLREEYARCDLWVNPAIVDSWGDAEGLGIGSIEAYLYGKPVVASSVGGIPDTVIDGVTGFLVEEKNPQQLARAICKLLSQPSLARKMGAAGYAFAEREFDWSTIIRQLVNLYRSVLPKPVTIVGHLCPNSTTASLVSTCSDRDTGL